MFDDSPSYKAGLKVGDVILKVDGESYEGKNSNDISNYIKNSGKSKIVLTVKRNNEEINLTNKEYELLMILIENKDEVVTRDELLERIWGYDTETNVTDVYIRHLRSKLNNENKEEYIQTVRSIGYIMRS